MREAESIDDTDVPGIMDYRGSYFKGYARLRIQYLDFDPSRHTYNKKVDDLIAQFETVGCHNDDISHAVPVLISENLLDEALETAGLAQSSLYNLGNGCELLNLREHTRLKCIYGRHRIRAAQRHLCEVERSWVVKLYDADMPADLIVDLEQEDLKFPNGRTLMYILDQDNQDVIDGWLRRNGEDHMEKCARIKNYDGGRLKPILQRLLRLKSLCCGMESIGSWDPIYAMHCYEEIYTYLIAITNMWTYILGPELHPEHLDESTVLALQLLNPAELIQDRKTVEDLFSKDRVFSLVKDSAIRAVLEQRVLTCKRIVSLESFFADFKLLRACFDGMKLLLPRERRKKSAKHRRKKEDKERSFRKKFEFNFGGHGQADFGNCYEDLWLWAMSQFPYLSDSKLSRPLQHTVSDGRQPRFSGCSDSKKAQLASKAHALWFRTEEISHLMGTSQREDLQQSPILGELNRPLQRRERMGRPTSENFKQNSRYLEREHVFSRLGSERYPITFLFWRDIAWCCWRTEARWTLAPTYQEYNDASNYDDRRGDDIRTELTRQQAINSRAQHHESEPRARRSTEGVDTSIKTPHAEETCQGSPPGLEACIRNYLKDVAETNLHDPQFHGDYDVKMEDQHPDHVVENYLRPWSSSAENLERKDEGEPFRSRSEDFYDGEYHLRNHEDDRDETKFSVDPLEPKAKRSIDNFVKDAQRQMDSEQEIFENDGDDNREDDYLLSGAHGDRTLVSRTSSVYSSQEDSTTEARRAAAPTLAHIAALGAKDESASDHGNQSLEPWERGKDKAATQEIVRISRRPPQAFEQEDIANRTVVTPMILIRPASYDNATAHDPEASTKQSDGRSLEPESPGASRSTSLDANPNRPMTQIILSSDIIPIGNRSKEREPVISETRPPAGDRVLSVVHGDDKSSKEQSGSAESKQNNYGPMTRSETNLLAVGNGTQSGIQGGHSLLHPHPNSSNADKALSSDYHRRTQIDMGGAFTPLGSDKKRKRILRKEDEAWKLKSRRGSEKG